MTIRTKWLEQLQFASQSSLSELIDSEARITGTLSGTLGAISAKDAASLETMGLPRIVGCLYPAIGAAEIRNGTHVYRLGSYDSGIHHLTEQPIPGGPDHFFIVETTTGRVAKVPKETPGYHVPVNASVRLFVETAWRYLYMQPVLFQMQHSGEGDVAFAEPDESQAIKQFVWDTVVRIDPSVAADGEDNFWDGATWGYL